MHWLSQLGVRASYRRPHVCEGSPGRHAHFPSKAPWIDCPGWRNDALILLGVSFCLYSRLSTRKLWSSGIRWRAGNDDLQRLPWVASCAYLQHSTCGQCGHDDLIHWGLPGQHTQHTQQGIGTDRWPSKIGFMCLAEWVYVYNGLVTSQHVVNTITLPVTGTQSRKQNGVVHSFTTIKPCIFFMPNLGELS